MMKCATARILLLSLCLLLTTSFLFALSISPDRYEITLLPGESAKGTYVVTNNTHNDALISISTRDWVIQDINKGISSDNWLKVSEQSINLAPGESKPVEFSVKAPRKAKGGLFAMISMNSSSSDSEMLSVAISVPVYVIIKGTEKIEASLNNLRISPEGENLQVSVEVQNRGNVHIRPEGKCVLESGSQKIEIQIPQGRPVYPGMTRTSIGRIAANKVPADKYSALVELKSGDLTLSATAQVHIDEKKNAHIIQ